MPHYAKPQYRHFITAAARGNMIMLRTGALIEAGGSQFYVSPFFVLVCAHAKHLVNILDCQGAVLWSNYCCATAESANVVSPITKQCCYEGT